MRHVSAALVVLVIGACGKGAERSPPAPAGNAAAQTPAPRPRDVPATVALPQLGGDASLESVPVGPLAIVDRAAIIIDGTEVVPIRDGAVEASHRGATAGALVIPRVAAWAASWHALPDARTAVVSLAVQPTQPARLALQVIESFAQSEQRDFALLARGLEGVGALPVRLPAKAGPTAPAPAEPPLAMALALTDARAVLWSLSGQEGTLSAPRAVIPVDADGAWVKRVREVLGELVHRRWAGRTRPVDETAIVIMIDPETTAGALVALIAAVRHDASGQPLFPDVRLSTGLVATDAPAAVARADRADARTLDETEAARFAEMLTATVDSDIGDMERRRPGSDLGTQIDAVRDDGAMVASGGSGDGVRAGDGDPRAGGDGGPPAGSAPSVAITSKAQLTDTSLTVDAVVQKLTVVYMSGVKRCYRDGLRLDPQLRGAVTIGLTVSDVGRVTDANVGAMTPALADCIEGMAANWRFAVPKDADGEPTRAEFKLGLGLAPR